MQQKHAVAEKVFNEGKFMRFSISVEELRKLLSKSFDDGYENYFDNKQDCVDYLIDKFVSEKNTVNSNINSFSYRTDNINEKDLKSIITS
jgi:hypothetical protein